MTTHSHCAWTNEGGHVKLTAGRERLEAHQLETTALEATQAQQSERNRERQRERRGEHEY